MDWLEALVLGLLQGLTEYLPVSSSGHLAISSALFGIDAEESLAFTIAVHVATVLSTLVVLWHEVAWLFKDLKSYCLHPSQGLNAGTRYSVNIVISMVPIGIVGLFFKEQVVEVFGSGLMVVGLMLLLTSVLLYFSSRFGSGRKSSLTMLDAFIVGLSQAVAVLPGLSRSGTTIATGLLLGNRKDSMAQFSFLMVIPPILGEALLDIKDMLAGGVDAIGVAPLPLVTGFVAAFVSGCLACKWMIGIVRRGKLAYFAAYCLVAGVATLVYDYLTNQAVG